MRCDGFPSSIKNRYFRQASTPGGPTAARQWWVTNGARYIAASGRLMRSKPEAVGFQNSVMGLSWGYAACRIR
jgi:hypothetical protein